MDKIIVVILALKTSKDFHPQNSEKYGEYNYFFVLMLIISLTMDSCATV